MQMPSAIASTGIATIPNISATGSDATHSVKGLGRGSSGFAAMGRSPIIRSPRFLNVDLILLFFATVGRVSCMRRRFPPPWSIEQMHASAEFRSKSR